MSSPQPKRENYSYELATTHSLRRVVDLLLRRPLKRNKRKSVRRRKSIDHPFCHGLAEKIPQQRNQLDRREDMKRVSITVTNVEERPDIVQILQYMCIAYIIKYKIRGEKAGR